VAGLLVFGGFRSHILLPHDVVGAISTDKRTWSWIEVQEREGEELYVRHGKPVLRISSVVSHPPGVTRKRVVMAALTEVWVQEPGLQVNIAGAGTWRGYGPRGRWTSDTYLLRQKDAHKATVHFPRVRTHPNYTVGVEFRNSQNSERWRIGSDAGYAKLLAQPVQQVPWVGCEVFGEGYDLAGVYVDLSERPLRRWELAGKPPDIGQMYFLGWVGGPGVVVNDKGRTPVPGVDVTAADGFNLLWHPRSWRRLRPGQVLSQTLTMRRL
jgi:hypothetical protein